MRTALLTLAVGGLLAAGLAVPANAAHEELVVTGLTQNDKLVTFVAGTGERLSQVKVSGIAAGQTLQAIDYRPNGDGGLYGVATGGGTGFLYLLSPTTGAATLVGPLTVPATAAAPARPAALTGEVSIDFNPTVDRLRILSTDDQNLRVNPANGSTTVDGTLSYGPEGQDPFVVGAAYTNNDDDCVSTPAAPCPAPPAATGTTLYDIDAAGDRLLMQNPPNNGTLVPVGPLGIDVDEATGFDVYTEEDGLNVALLSTRTAEGTLVHTVNLATGAVTTTATSGVRAQGAPVVDIAVDPRQ